MTAADARRRMAEEIAKAVRGVVPHHGCYATTKEGDILTNAILDALSRHAPAAGAWTTVTDDPETWPGADAEVISETDYHINEPKRRHECGGEIIDRWNAWCHKEEPPEIRWMPWPSPSGGEARP